MLMNKRLTRAISNQENKEAVYSINPTKAPGSDGWLYWKIFLGFLDSDRCRHFVKLLNNSLQVIN